MAWDGWPRRRGQRIRPRNPSAYHQQRRVMLPHGQLLYRSMNQLTADRNGAIVESGARVASRLTGATVILQGVLWGGTGRHIFLLPLRYFGWCRAQLGSAICRDLPVLRSAPRKRTPSLAEPATPTASRLQRRTDRWTIGWSGSAGSCFLSSGARSRTLRTISLRYSTPTRSYVRSGPSCCP